MKSILIKLNLLGVFLLTFSLQAFTPPMPQYTTIKINDLYWDNNSVSTTYYSVKVVVTGWLLNDNTTTHQSEVIIASPSQSSAYFTTDFQAYYSGYYGPLTEAHVYGKKYSNSNWTDIGTASIMEQFVSVSNDGYYLYQMEFSKLNLNVEEPIE